MEILIFFSYSFFLFFSIFGYGLIYRKIIYGFQNNQNLAIDGILGLFFIFSISSFTHIFFQHHYLHNIFLHIVGISFFIYSFNKKKINSTELKFFIIIFFLLLSSFLISKTNEDFPYYHLPFSFQIVDQKLNFGLGNLNHGFKQFSSIFMLNSIFFLPGVDVYLFNYSGFAILVFFTLFSLIEIFKRKNDIFSRSILILTVLLVLSKFSRLSEYGTDIPGQLIVFICFIYFFKTLNISNSPKSFWEPLNIILTLLIFSITIKSMYLIYLVLPFYLFIKIKNKYSFLKYFFTNKNFLFLFISFIFLFLFNFSSTGCLLYPVKFTCFPYLTEWSLADSTLNYMSNHYESWAKSLNSQNFSYEEKLFLSKNLNWIGFWIKNYFFTKVTDYIFLLLFLILIFFLVYKNSIQLKKNINKFNFFEVYLLILIPFFVWFLNFPALRYAGYVIVSYLFFLPFIFYFISKNLTFKNFEKKTKILICIAFLIFNIKNLNRINNQLELSLNDNHNFKNFPFYWIKKVNYNELIINDQKVYLINKDMCWNTPPPCVRNLNFKINKINNYNFFIIDDK